MADDWEVIDQEVAWQGYFRMDRYHLRHRRFDGSWTPVIQREVFERGHAVAVLPWDPARDQLLLVEQFRVGAVGTEANPWLLELIAGMIETGESAADVARREAVEEAGITLGRLEPICDYLVSPGGTTERTSLFLALADLDGAGGIHGLDDEHEDIRVHVQTVDETIAWLDAGRINNAAGQIALQWFARHRDRLRDAYQSTAD